MKIAVFCKYVIVSITIIFIGGCCEYVDCLYDDYSCAFVIKSKNNREDLIFGKQSSYKRKNMTCFSVSQNDTIYYEISFIEYHSNISDSVISIQFYPETSNQIYFKIDNIDNDTIILKFNSYNTKCCGNITEISNVNINMVNYPKNKGPIQIYK
ncbi:MAG TPA: hypothetical protein PLD02_11125 [Saprospiraceae bacterium]|nr:hypothetical protein [Saprospiraceae bacterium]